MMGNCRLTHTSKQKSFLDDFFIYVSCQSLNLIQLTHQIAAIALQEIMLKKTDSL